MKPSFRKTLGKLIEKKLRKFPQALDATVPAGGWLRAIRVGAGMPARRPADRLGLTTQGYEQLEKNESAGTITLKSLRRAANAIDCDLVYAVIPRRGSVQAMIDEQAMMRARKTLLPVAHSMLLEGQGSPKPGPKVRALARQIAARPNRALWEK